MSDAILLLLAVTCVIGVVLVVRDARRTKASIGTGVLGVSMAQQNFSKLEAAMAAAEKTTRKRAAKAKPAKPRAKNPAAKKVPAKKAGKGKR